MSVKQITISVNADVANAYWAASEEEQQKFCNQFSMNSKTRYVFDTNVITVTVKVCRDPRDDRILELAVSGDATFVVTGDSDLLVLNSFRGVQIVTPSQLLGLITKQSHIGEV